MSKQCYRWVITINDPNTPSRESDFISQVPPEALQNLFEELGCSKWIFQLEQGEETARFHYQGAFALKKKRTKTSLLFYLQNLLTLQLTHLDEDAILGVTKNITIDPMMDSTEGFDYSEKTKTRIRGPWSLKQSWYDGSDLPALEDFFHIRSSSLSSLRLSSLIERIKHLEYMVDDLYVNQTWMLSTIDKMEFPDDDSEFGIH